LFRNTRHHAILLVYICFNCFKTTASSCKYKLWADQKHRRRAC